MVDLHTVVDEHVHREFAPVVAAIETRFDVQDAKIETLTVAVKELTGAIAATNTRVESLTAKVATQNARIGALYWMFGTLIALFMVLVALGVYTYLFPPPSEAGSVTPS